MITKTQQIEYEYIFSLWAPNKHSETIFKFSKRINWLCEINFKKTKRILFRWIDIFHN